MPDGILKINVCSQSYYREKSGTIDIEFTPNIMPHIAGLSEKFTMFKLNDIAGLDSIYSTRLYELLMQWKTVGELELTIQELRFSLGCVNKFNLYNDFKRFAFGHAVNEINSKFDINLSFKEIKTGREITDVAFKFKAIQRQEFYDVYQQQMRTKVSSFKKKTKKINPNNDTQSTKIALSPQPPQTTSATRIPQPKRKIISDAELAEMIKRDRAPNSEKAMHNPSKELEETKIEAPLQQLSPLTQAEPLTVKCNSDNPDLSQKESQLKLDTSPIQAQSENQNIETPVAAPSEEKRQEASIEETTKRKKWFGIF